jgi:two-component system, chemotaxis family, CheB/CheR fusion protein
MNPYLANDSTGGYVVGIGASAGGLEAINELFDNIPQGTNFSFILIQHLSPDFKSLMPELLGKHTTMQVYVAEDNMPIKPNCVYLIPARNYLTIKDGYLHLKDQVRDGQPNTAVDTFLQSLAQDKGNKSIGIILSGTGSDGTKGVEAIKNAGGIVIVQDPVSAEFDGMPKSAISTGAADLILPPEMMGDELLGFIKEAPLLKSLSAMNHQEEAVILDILELVYKTTEHNFSHYKRPTITRRMAKRMTEKNFKSFIDYFNYLQAHPEEVKALCRDFLINVTQFFRDEEGFALISEKVLPSLFEGKKAGDIIKVWVVATSTGEESYSLAILLEEYLQAHKLFNIGVKIFATDVDQQAIEIASRGFYSEEAVKNISPERLKNFFIKEGPYYRVSSALRKSVVFAKHDITKDPPYSKIDLLTCRNMLIYMNNLLQKNVLQKLHFAINEGGFLFLGPSENIGILRDVMTDVDRKWKIYQCISKEKVGGQEAFVIGTGRDYEKQVSAKTKNALNNLPEIFSEVLQEGKSYAGILIDKDFEVKQAIGNFKSFLSFPEDRFNFNLLKLVPTDLSITLSTCIRKAIQNNVPVVQKRVKVQHQNSSRSIDLIVKPYLNQRTYLQPFVFIILNESEETIKEAPPFTADTASSYTEQQVLDLFNELRDTKENLQSVIEELESTNEELQSSNEEILSSNEELQSTNEELQSLNEELHTVNTEHQQKIKELMDLNDDLNNYFNNTDIGQILIDHKLIIRRFTPAITRLINLIPSDIGRSIMDISTNLKGVNIINDIKGVILTNEHLEKEVHINDDHIYLMRIVPYERQNKTTNGVVVNFIDISDFKRLSNILEAVFNSSTSGITHKRPIRNAQKKIIDFEYVAMNESAEAMLNVEPHGLIGKHVLQEFPHLNKEYFKTYVEVVEKGNSAVFEMFNEDNKHWYEVTCVKMMDGMVSTYTDITDKKIAADLLKKGYDELHETYMQLETTNMQLERSNFDLMQFASVASHDLKEPLRKIQAFGNMLKESVEERLDRKEYNYLDKVINASNRMQNLVDDILTLSRLSNNTIPKISVSLTDIVNSIVDDLEIMIHEKKAVVKVGNLPTIHAVPGQMHQLFQNLVTNALKFNETEIPVVTIEQKAVIDKNEFSGNGISESFISVVVEDNGIGFEEEYREKIFGIFQRLEKTNYPGTGIGLAICKKIVENHGGFIKAESQPGKGSRFIVVLPGE